MCGCVCARVRARACVGIWVFIYLFVQLSVWLYVCLFGNPSVYLEFFLSVGPSVYQQYLSIIIVPILSTDHGNNKKYLWWLCWSHRHQITQIVPNLTPYTDIKRREPIRLIPKHPPLTTTPLPSLSPSSYQSMIRIYPLMPLVVSCPRADCKPPLLTTSNHLLWLSTILASFSPYNNCFYNASTSACLLQHFTSVVPCHRFYSTLSSIPWHIPRWVPRYRFYSTSGHTSVCTSSYLDLSTSAYGSGCTSSQQINYISRSTSVRNSVYNSI